MQITQVDPYSTFYLTAPIFLKNLRNQRQKEPIEILSACEAPFHSTGILPPSLSPGIARQTPATILDHHTLSPFRNLHIDIGIPANRTILLASGEKTDTSPLRQKFCPTFSESVPTPLPIPSQDRQARLDALQYLNKVREKLGEFHHESAMLLRNIEYSTGELKGHPQPEKPSSWITYICSHLEKLEQMLTQVENFSYEVDKIEKKHLSCKSETDFLHLPIQNTRSEIALANRWIKARGKNLFEIYKKLASKL